MFAEFIALAKQKPGALNFASAAPPARRIWPARCFKQVAKIDIVHIPHKGAPEAATSILRNDSQLYFATASGITELIESKRSRRWRSRAPSASAAAERSDGERIRPAGVCL